MTLLPFFLEHFRRQRGDPAITFNTNFTGHRAKYTRTDRLVILAFDQNTSVFVKADRRAIFTLDFLLRPNHYGLMNRTFFDLAIRQGLFNGDDDNISDGSVASRATSNYLKALYALSTGIIGTL